MGRGLTTARSRGSSTKPSKDRVKPRSLALTDEDWGLIERFAKNRGLVSRSDAARLLLHTGLKTEALVEELAAAQAWQIAQAWADAQAIADGDRTIGSWERIREAGERARARIRERESAGRIAAGG